MSAAQERTVTAYKVPERLEDVFPMLQFLFAKETHVLSDLTMLRYRAPNAIMKCFSLDEQLTKQALYNLRATEELLKARGLKLADENTAGQSNASSPASRGSSHVSDPLLAGYPNDESTEPAAGSE